LNVSVKLRGDENEPIHTDSETTNWEWC
jgi:hypothetical protein